MLSLMWLHWNEVMVFIMKPVGAELTLFHLLLQRNHTEQTTEALTCFEPQINNNHFVSHLNSNLEIKEKQELPSFSFQLQSSGIQLLFFFFFSCRNNTTAIVCLHFAMKYRQTKPHCTVYCEVLQEKLTFLGLLHVFIYTMLRGSVPDSTVLSTEGMKPAVCAIAGNPKNFHHGHKIPMSWGDPSRVQLEEVKIPEVSLWQAPNLGTVLRNPYLHNNVVTRKSATSMAFLPCRARQSADSPHLRVPFGDWVHGEVDQRLRSLGKFINNLERSLWRDTWWNGNFAFLDNNNWNVIFV